MLSQWSILCRTSTAIAPCCTSMAKVARARSASTTPPIPAGVFWRRGASTSVSSGQDVAPVVVALSPCVAALRFPAPSPSTATTSDCRKAVFSADCKRCDSTTSSRRAGLCRHLRSTTIKRVSRRRMCGSVGSIPRERGCSWCSMTVARRPGSLIGCDHSSVRCS